LAETAKRDSAELGYLLGTLSEDEKGRMEEAFFADDAQFERLELAEDELIDDYVRQRLSPEEQQQFETKLRASPRLVERVHFARALAKKADSAVLPEAEYLAEVAQPVSPPAPGRLKRWWATLFTQQPTLGLATAACALLILVTGVAVSRWWRLRSEFERLASERATLQNQKQDLEKLSSDQRTKIEQLAAEQRRASDQEAEHLKLIEKLQREGQLQDTTNRQQPLPSAFATVVLSPGSLRSGGSQPELVIGPKIATASIRLLLERNNYAAFNIEIEPADGTPIYRKSRLTPASRSQLILSIPARLLSPNDYIVNVEGVTASGQVESLASYQFRVSKLR
jgi:hypothetical protein